MRFLVVLPLMFLFACSSEQPPDPSEELKKPIEKAEAVEEQLEEAQRARDEAVEDASK